MLACGRDFGSYLRTHPGKEVISIPWIMFRLLALIAIFGTAPPTLFLEISICTCSEVRSCEVSLQEAGKDSEKEIHRLIQIYFP